MTDYLTDEEHDALERLKAPLFHEERLQGFADMLAARLSEARRELDEVRADLYRARSDGLWDEFVEVRAARDAVVRERDSLGKEQARLVSERHDLAMLVLEIGKAASEDGKTVVTPLTETVRKQRVERDAALAKLREIDVDPHGPTERQVDALLERNPNLPEASRVLRAAAEVPASLHMAPTFRLAADRADARQLVAALARVAELSAALVITRRWLSDAETKPIDAYEDIADWFHVETGMLRPGKDVGAYDDHSPSYEVRAERFAVWCREKGRTIRAQIDKALGTEPK